MRIRDDYTRHVFGDYEISLSYDLASWMIGFGGHTATIGTLVTSVFVVRLACFSFVALKSTELCPTP